MSNTLLKQWRNISTNDEILKKDLSKKDDALKDIFLEKMSFGTAGIRGIMGAGTNKMNEFTVAAAADAYAKYLIKNVKGAKTKGVIIGHDNRHNSKLFSEVTAKVLMNNGIKSFLYENNDLQPTPLVSYTIRKLKLAGGAIITASHNPKEYNGFKVYNSLGGQLMPKETNKIQDIMKNINPLEVKRSTKEIKQLDNKIVDSYIDETIKSISIVKEKPSIKVAFSPLHGTSAKVIPNALNKIGIKNYIVQKQMTPDGNFKYTKSTNPEEAKAYSKVVSLARKKKADLAIITDPDADRIGVVVKYKKRYKYLNGNQLAALYLDYKLTQLKKSNKLPKDGYIVKSVVSGNLAANIAKKFGIKVYETHVGFKNIADLIERTKGTFVLGYEESYGMVLDSSLVRDKDSLQATIGVIEMVNHYKINGINTFSHFKEIEKEFGIHRSIQFSKKLNEQSTNRLLKKISRTKELDGYKVKEVQDYRKGYKNFEKADFVKIVLSDDSWIAVRPSGTEPKVKTYVQIIGEKGQDLIHTVIREKEAKNFIDDSAEEFPDKKFSWKVVLKYFIFTAIMVGLLLLVFKGIYSQYSSTNSVFKQSIDFKNTIALWILFAGIAGMFFNILVDGWMKYRLLRFHGQNVKVRHLVISSIMGSIISYLTPLAIGGDGIGYWYLRRKGFKRAPLAATFLTSTVLWQMKNIVLTAIFLPMGIHMFKDLLLNGTPESKSVMVIFVIGLIWDMFSIFMLWLLLMARWFQNWAISTAITFLEWMPLVTLADPGAKASSFMSEFANLRKGMKKIWRSPKMLAESMFYETLPKLLSIGALLNMAMGVIKPDLVYGQYWSQIIATDVVNTANSFSLTPGSTGFIEFISLHIRDQIYVGRTSAKDTVMNMDIMYKLIQQWPYLILSSLLAITVVIGESRRKRYKSNSKYDIDSKSDTTFYKKTAIIWPLFIAGWISLIVLL